MDIKIARSLVDEMLEICSQVDEYLAEAAEGIYRDIHAAKNVEAISDSVRELMIFVNDAPWESYDIDELRNDIEILYEKFMTDFEEF